MTRDARRRSNDAVQRSIEARKVVSQSKSRRQQVDALLDRLGPQWNTTRDQVTDSLEALETKLGNIEEAFPALNTIVCDRGGNPCDTHCGGAGCGKCGGFLCDNGAVTTAENALKYAQDALTELKSKDRGAEDLLRSVRP